MQETDKGSHMNLVDLIAYRPQHEIRQVLIKPIHLRLLEDWYYLARSISIEEASYQIRCVYKTKTLKG